MYCERWWTSAATEKTMSAVLESCRGSPFTVDHRRSAWGSTSAAGTSAGPTGLKDSAHLPLDHCPPESSSWNVRSDTSWLVT